MTEPDPSEIVKRVSEIVAAYVRHNTVGQDDLPGLIREVHDTLVDLTDQTKHSQVDASNPAVPIEESVTDDFIYSLEDGQPYKSLKRHLKAKYGMSPEDYREKWGLPADYPMVAPAYARERSRLAKRSGLGRHPSGPY